jgi:hypothetical protein
MFTKIAMKNLSPIHFIYAGLIVLLLVVGAVVRYTPTQDAVTALDAEAYVANIEEQELPVFESIRDSLKDIIDAWGIEGALEINEHAFVNNKIGIYHCHVLTHLIGHEAIIYYGQDYDEVVAHDRQFCELGYRHGAEAQVALSGGNYKEELYAMCDAIQRKDPSADCFHGAGHAFMNESLDVDTSLQMCDELINETHDENDVAPCYNAVFAELTNLVGGKDGGTGIDYTGGPPLSMEEKSPLEYCNKFDRKYGIQCVFEFSGLGVSEHSTPADIAQKLLGCSNEEYDEELEAACIRSVSAVGAQHELAKSQTIVVPEHIHGLPKVLRESYIRGTGIEMMQYLISGADRDWRAFCDAFINEDDILMCEELFEGQV